MRLSSQSVLVRDFHVRMTPSFSKMECLAEPMSAYPFDHLRELLERLDILRNNDSFCDVTIAVKDKEFKAHRAVLAAASPFFLALLTSDMKERNEQLIKVDLEEATESVVEDTLKYLYTGNVTIIEERAHNLLATANYLLLPGLKTMVSDFLEDRVTTQNCVFNYYFADKYECVELKSKCCEVINSDFSVVMETGDFLNLHVKQVMEWVSSDNVMVNAEEDVFIGIVMWVSHNKSEREKHFPELLHQVRLPFVSHDFLLNELVNEELITENPEFCSNFVINAMKSVLNPTDGEASWQPRKCQETHTDGIFVCGGKKALCYFPLEGHWYKLVDTLFEHDNPCLVQHKSKVYIFDSKVHKVGESRVVEYYEDNSALGTTQRAKISLRSGSYTVLNGKLYAISLSFNIIEIYKYNTETNDWDEMKSLRSLQKYPCVVNDQQFLYVISGRESNITVRFDSGQNNWKKLAAVNEERYNAFGAAMNDKIYIAGGRSSSNYKALSSCEVYNTATNEWQLMPSLNVPRYSASMVCFAGQLYVLGGIEITQRGVHKRALGVEMFDFERNQWTQKSAIPVESFEREDEKKKDKIFQACVARICKRVINKLGPLDINPIQSHVVARHSVGKAM